MVLFGTAALFAFQRWRESPGRETAWLALAGVFAGAAAAVKYLGLLFVAAGVLGAAPAPPPARRWPPPPAAAAGPRAAPAAPQHPHLAAPRPPRVPPFPP